MRAEWTHGLEYPHNSLTNTKTQAKAAKKEKKSKVSAELDEAKSGSKRSADDDEQERPEKRPRTRSMDAADCAKLNEETDRVVEKSTPKPTSSEWRSSHSITITSTTPGYDAPDPILDFKTCPFDARLNKALVSAGFPAPTIIQSQSWPITSTGIDTISIAKTGESQRIAKNEQEVSRN